MGVASRIRARLEKRAAPSTVNFWCHVVEGSFWSFGDALVGLGEVLAVPAHELTHAYLRHHGIRGDSRGYELLTEFAAVYLGLDPLLVRGYEPVEWTSDHQVHLWGSTWRQHKGAVGYLAPATIARGVVEAAKLREWRPAEVASALPFLDGRDALRELTAPDRVAQSGRVRPSPNARGLKQQVAELGRTYDELWYFLDLASYHRPGPDVPARVPRTVAASLEAMASKALKHKVDSLAASAEAIDASEGRGASKYKAWLLSARLARMQRELSRQLNAARSYRAYSS